MEPGLCLTNTLMERNKVFLVTEGLDNSRSIAIFCEKEPEMWLKIIIAREVPLFVEKGEEGCRLFSRGGKIE